MPAAMPCLPSQETGVPSVAAAAGTVHHGRPALGALVAAGFVMSVLLAGCRDAATSATPAADPFSAADAPVLPATTPSYAIGALPSHIASDPLVRVDVPADNPITDAGATLGRVLFYDPRLSQDGRVSCASCHGPATGFTDTARVSLGVGRTPGLRNSMPLTNLAVTRTGPPIGFFWDARVVTLEAQAATAMAGAREMNLPPDSAAVRLAAVPWYPVLFERAFGSRTITGDRITRAIAQFQRSMVSFRSRYDSAFASNFASLTPQERLGQRLFGDGTRIGCGGCHGGPTLLLNAVPRNIGLDAVPADRGAGAITGQTADDGKFRVGTLRNVALTAPYMHDGRFATLEAVVRFYSTDIQAHPNLAVQLQDQLGRPRRPNYTDEEVQALVAFLRTLTDTSIARDPRFTNPFRR